ncbi:CPBP family glutamic-type intramembrane protease [Halarsenatibacter silvermanii]|uniref:CAAX prenyl protease 2/Lysostaphin resistance protein A-like domain-containing protein n=1 Tax=Halarsenatibacter silvermanii TaxID=321763 RepID=A0A1G9SDR2_9FIRM|nr:CPBP family glutamic-type intramembrane protease [Halarsenatibacter silvermanii]SDM33613.1 hypothetical protein SAMN04488692_1288 [Halarsenatibacter silvermanii]
MAEEQNLSLKTLILLQSALALVSFVIIKLVFDPGMGKLWLYPSSLYYNLVMGAAGAIILYFPAYLYLRHKKKELLQAVRPLLPICRRPIALLAAISFLAGLSEELLFRALLQRLLGIWPASILFMLAHAGFWAAPPRTQARMLFAPFSLAAGLLMGLLFREAGLTAAVTAHFLYDLAAFVMLKKEFIGVGRRK